GDAQVLGTDAMQRRERSVQHVIDAVVRSRFFYRGNVGWLFHHTHEALVACGAGAIDTRLDIGDVVADGAEVQALLEISDRRRQGFGLVFTAAQNMKGKT